MKRGDVYDYETGELIRKGTEDGEDEEKEHSGLFAALYVLGGIAKVLGVVFLGVGAFFYYLFKAMTK